MRLKGLNGLTEGVKETTGKVKKEGMTKCETRGIDVEGCRQGRMQRVRKRKLH